MLGHEAVGNLAERGHADGRGKELVRVAIHRNQIPFLLAGAQLVGLAVAGEEDEQPVLGSDLQPELISQQALDRGLGCLVIGEGENAVVAKPLGEQRPLDRWASLTA